MNRDAIRKLYNETILTHNKKPYHFQKRSDLNVSFFANNPICGDRFEVYLEVWGEDIKHAWFHGFGCALSKASLSILIKRLEGMSYSTALAFCRKFIEQMEEPVTEKTEIPLPEQNVIPTTEQKKIPEIQQPDKSIIKSDQNGELDILLALKEHKARIDCLLLGWRAVVAHILSNS